MTYGPKIRRLGSDLSNITEPVAAIKFPRFVFSSVDFMYDFYHVILLYVFRRIGW